MSYESLKAQLTRTPITLVRLTLDWCARSYGVAPCTASAASGYECYNTYLTCQDKTNFSRTTRVYKFSSLDAPLPFAGVRPYVQEVNYLPTEIKDSLTVKGRVTVTLADEPDTDVGLDPYLATRSSVQGTFWKKLLARNPNFKGRQVEILEGFAGLAEEDFVLRWAGVIDNITLRRGAVRLEVVDLLEQLDKIEVPPKLKLELVGALTDSTTEIVISDVSDLSTSGYVRIGDEIIAYTGITVAQNTLTGCSRGQFDTTAEAHSAGTKVEPVVYYAPGNPFDILKSMLTNAQSLTESNPPGAGIAAARIDTDAWDEWRDWPGGDVDFSAILVKPVKLSKLFFEIVQLLDCSVWQNEAQQITIRRNVPNQPGRTYTELTDDEHIIEGSAEADLNEKSRKTRLVLYWDKTALGDDDKPDSYRAIDVAVDAEAESDVEYGEPAEEKIFCRWLRLGYAQEETIKQAVANLAARWLFVRRDAQPILEWQVELKDEAVQTGDHVRLTTDELLLPDGNPLDRAIFQIWRRDPKGHRVNYRALRVTAKPFAFIAPDTTPDFDSATDAQKEYGFICRDDGLMDDATPGYSIW